MKLSAEGHNIDICGRRAEAVPVKMQRPSEHLTARAQPAQPDNDDRSHRDRIFAIVVFPNLQIAGP